MIVNEHIKRKEIFKEELVKLKYRGLISEEEFNRMNNVYKSYYETTINQPLFTKASVKNGEKSIIKKEKKILTPQEIKERNITWSLNLGVIFILIAGLVLATSNWEMMNNITKTLVVTFVSGMFFGISVLSERILKIKKTAFAFWILGSLLLPVSILSAGYFQLFGEWLSVFGEGKYLLGVIGATLCLPLYGYSTYKYKHRIFSWITLIALSLNVIFIFKALYLRQDLFYLFMIIYNSILLFINYKYKEYKNLSLFTKELSVFTQINILFTTLFILIDYLDLELYGYNILLTSLLYMLMVFNKERKEYSFVFTALFVYGVYQIVSNSLLFRIDIILYALMGYVFILLEGYQREDKVLSKIYKYSNAIISLLVFIFITFKGSTGLTPNSPVIILISYVLIFINYLYLSNTSTERVFKFIAPLYLVAAWDQVYNIIDYLLPTNIYAIFMFIGGLLLFISVYYYNKSKWLKAIEVPSAIVSVMVMYISTFGNLFAGHWISTTILTYIFVFILFMIYEKTTLKPLQVFIKWIMPVILFRGTVIIFMHIVNSFYKYNYEFSIHLWISAVFVLMIGFVLRKMKPILESSFFWIGHILVALSLIVTILTDIDYYMIFILSTFLYLYSIFRYDRELMKRGFLYATFILINLSILSVQNKFLWDAPNQYSIAITSLIIGVLWVIMKDKWRERISIYLILSSLLAIIGLNYIVNFQITELSFIIILITFSLYLIYREKYHNLNGLILATVLITMETIQYAFPFGSNRNWMVFISIVLFVLLQAASKLLYKRLYFFNISITNKKMKAFIDWYSVFSFVMIFLLWDYVPYNGGVILEILPSLVLVYYFYSQINRVDNIIVRKVIETFMWLSIMIPYYIILDTIRIPEIIRTELFVLPWITIAILFKKRVYADYESILEYIELGVLALVSLVLLRDIVVLDYFQDGIIFGALALMSLIVGMHYKIKTYFIVGITTLLINLIIQTKDLWTNLPWWSYLLITGLILITFASLNEVQKNRNHESFIKKLSIKIENIFKNWK